MYLWENHLRCLWGSVFNGRVIPAGVVFGAVSHRWWWALEQLLPIQGEAGQYIIPHLPWISEHACKEIGEQSHLFSSFSFPANWYKGWSNPCLLSSVLKRREYKLTILGHHEDEREGVFPWEKGDFSPSFCVWDLSEM